MKTIQNAGGFTVVVTGVRRTETLRTVYVHFPHVPPMGADYTPNHGRHFELTSFKGGPVELYVIGSDGIPMYQGTVRAYAPGKELRQAFRAAWIKEQPCKAAKEAFEASAQ